MNRRGFFKSLAKTVISVAVAPSISNIPYARSPQVFVQGASGVHAIPFWSQTLRRYRCVSPEYKAFFEQLVKKGAREIRVF